MCREAKAYGGGKCHEMTLREFLDTWWGAESWQKPAGGLTESAPLHLTQPAALYLKDWHFVNEFPAYKVPFLPASYHQGVSTAHCTAVDPAASQLRAISGTLKAIAADQMQS